MNEWSTSIQPPGLMKMRLMHHQEHYQVYQAPQNKPATWLLPSLHRRQHAGLHLREGAADVQNSAVDRCQPTVSVSQPGEGMLLRVQVLQSAEGMSTSRWSPNIC